jgi:tRNA pseudouridine65 synthase
MNDVTIGGGEGVQQSAELPILYQDDNLVAIYKPAGLLVHRSPIDKRETRFAVQQLRDQIGQHVFPLHRLDRPTAGVLLFALNSATASVMSQRLAERRVIKRYRALVRGFVSGCGHIDYALSYQWDKYADAERVKAVAPQSAQTFYQAKAWYEVPFAVGRYASARYSLVDMLPSTGRKHQLRRHMAHIRHPILGDTSHGDGKQNKFMREHFNLRRLLLVCMAMEFQHPISGKWLCISTDVDSEINQLLLSLSAYKVNEIK